MNADDDLSAFFPDAASRGLAAPVRVGVDNRTGKILIGWGHVLQSLDRLFATRFHERVLRRWVGSFVPHLLGENATRSDIVRYFSAINTAVDLWEPCYSIEYIRVCDQKGSLTNIESVANRLRLGQIAFRTDGFYMPRGHLGDRTIESRRSVVFVGTGTGVIHRVPV